MSSYRSKMSLRPPRSKKDLKEKILVPQTSTMNDKNPQIQGLSGQLLRGLRNSRQEHRILLHKNCNSYEKPLIEPNADNDDDVLVKHMMNLPDYLQRADEGEYVQGKALNYGVLDWHRLEKWKGNSRVNPARSNVNSSASGSGSARFGTDQTKQPQLISSSSYIGSSKEKSLPHDAKGSSVSVKRLDRQKRPHFKDKSRSRHYSSIKVGMGRENASGQKFSVNKTSALEFSSNVCSKTEDVLGGQSVELEDRVDCFPQNSCPDTFHHSRAKSLCEGELMKTRKSEDFPDLSTFEGDIYKKKHLKVLNSSLPSGGKTIIQPNTTLALQNLSLDCEVSSNANVVSSNQRIADIETRRSTYMSHSDRFINSLSHLKRSLSFNQESYSSKQKFGKLTYEADPDVFSEIPHSCPLLAGAEATMDSNSRSFNSTDIRSTKLQKLSSQSDRFHLVSTEHSSLKGGHQLSPERSFSFRLRKRLSRSFSSRESFDFTQLSSMFTPMKCGLVSSEKSDSLNNNVTAPASRVKMSPLRRLLDPICKRKVVKPDNKTTTNEASSSASSQAVLHIVTSTNGFPLFKLLVNNGSDIIIAMKASNPPQKDVSSCIYTLYSAQELKKSGNWMNPLDKGKSCGFGYNAVGHLKVHVPCSPKGRRIGEDQFTVRESVLYKIENGDAGKGTPKLMPGRELAAIIVKANECSKQEEPMLKGFKNCNSKTTVLLPEGVHSLPDKGGEPSPLIDRWRNGGSCDCGGWDVGCQLQILSNEEDHQHSGSSTDCFIPDHLHLFDQGGEVKELDEKKPLFSLAKYKEGTYMVEFSGSISSLQACSISIAALSASQIPSCDDETGSSQEQNSTFSRNNSRQPFKGAEYVSFPPASPVERV